MHISVNNQKNWKKENFYGGEGTIGGRAAIGFGNPAAEGSRVKSSLRLEIPQGATVGNHIHGNAEELYVVLSGKGIHTAEGDNYEVNPGDVISTPAGLNHSIRPTGTETLVVQAALIESK